MYVLNSMRNGWWEKITLIVWGPSAKLLSEDQELQIMMGQMMETGIDVKACQACTDHYGVSNKLRSMDIEVKFMGKDLTSFLKGPYKVVTF